MKTTPLIIVLAVLALSIGFGVRASFETHQLQAAIASLASQRVEVREKIARMEERLRTALDAGAKLEEETAAVGRRRAAAVEQASVQGERKSKTEAVARRINPESLVANDPPKMREFAANLREHFGLNYGGMFKAFGLSPGQVEKMTDLLVWLEVSRLDLNAVIEVQGLDAKSQAYKTLWNDWEQMRKTKLAEQLGDLTDRFREYEDTSAAYDIARRIASTETYSETPVTSAQVRRVAEILAANSRRRSDGSLENGTLNWDVARSQLGAVLTPAQIVTLGYFVESDTAEAKLTQQRKRLTAQFNRQSLPK